MQIVALEKDYPVQTTENGVMSGELEVGVKGKQAVVRVTDTDEWFDIAGGEWHQSAEALARRVKHDSERKDADGNHIPFTVPADEAKGE